MSGFFDRRQFIKQAAAAGLTLGVAGQAFAQEKKGKKKAGAGKGAAKKAQGPTVISKPVDNVPPSERLRVAVAGVNSRGGAHIKCFSDIPGVDVIAVCDPDSRALAKGVKSASELTGKAAAGIKDYRKLLELKDLDAVSIASPDHWHTPMSIMALAAGKHVYCEKPATHNPREGELLVQAVEKFKKVFQMGNQRRSYPEIRQAIDEIRGGKLIGNAYFARCSYTNARAPIGFGKAAPVPEWLGADGYDLWQGPAPRRPYKDNIIHYNWHWFWHWGTGESLNNGTHEIDLCRWALGVDFPTRVASTGGRFHYVGQDDWECPDTQIVTMDFPGGKCATWEGRSCNPFNAEGSARGSVIFGTEGSVVLAGHDVTVYDLKGKEIKKVEGDKIDPTNTLSPDIKGDTMHFANFIAAVRGVAPANSPAAEGVKTCLLMHLANISLRTSTMVNVDSKTGKIVGNPAAQQLWAREYEKGWEPQQYLSGGGREIKPVKQNAVPNDPYNVGPSDLQRSR